MTQSDIAQLSAFIDSHKNAFPDPGHVASRAVLRGFTDAAFEAVFAAGIRIRRMTKSRKKDG